jgi:Acetyltransferase (GNAT) domain
MVAGSNPPRPRNAATRGPGDRAARHTDDVPYPQPTLTDGRLALRPPRLDDIPAITAACQDPEIPRWTRVPSPYTEEHARQWLEAEFEGVRAAIVDVEDRFLGTVALMELDAGRASPAVQSPCCATGAPPSSG